MAQPTFTADHIRFWLHQLRELNTQKLEHRRRLINSFVNAVYLYDDYLVFVGNYKDSTKTITFAELEEIGLSSDAFASGVPNNKEDTHKGYPLYYFALRAGGTRKGGTSGHSGAKIESWRAIFRQYEVTPDL